MRIVQWVRKSIFSGVLLCSIGLPAFAGVHVIGSNICISTSSYDTLHAVAAQNKRTGEKVWATFQENKKYLSARPGDTITVSLFGPWESEDAGVMEDFGSFMVGDQAGQVPLKGELSCVLNDGCRIISGGC
jgi:hypothetical protein